MRTLWTSIPLSTAPEHLLGRCAGRGGRPVCTFLFPPLCPVLAHISLSQTRVAHAECYISPVGCDEESNHSLVSCCICPGSSSVIALLPVFMRKSYNGQRDSGSCGDADHSGDDDGCVGEV
eukprot:758974-Hanusia_phi.AAC.3